MLVSSFLLIKSTLNCKDGKQNFYLKQVEQPSFHQFYNPSLFILYCFRMPESICNKMDSIVRAFWWGHELGEHKLHLIKWDQVCQPKRNGGLGIKKFSLMNQAMFAKQYWRITQNSNSLLARTFKAKYFPRGSMQECSPKPHHSWI